MQSVDQEGKTLEEALEKAISILKCKKEDIEYEILDEGSKGIFGVGARPVIVRVRLKKELLDQKENEQIVSNSLEDSKSSYDNDNNIIDNENDKLKSIITKFCKYLSLDLKELKILNEDSNVKINIETDDANLLIGKHGKTLEALQYIINQIMHEEKTKFILDISNYRIKQNEKLVSLIKNIAERVKNNKRRVVLNPMSSSDRKVVHEVIKEYPELTTRSVGTEPNRKVVIEHKESVKRQNNFKKKNFDKNRKNLKPYNKTRTFKRRISENKTETKEEA